MEMEQGIGQKVTGAQDSAPQWVVLRPVSFLRQCPGLECGHRLLDSGIVLALVVLYGHMREHPESQQTHARVGG